MKKIDVFFCLVLVCLLVGLVIVSQILFARVTVDDVVILVKDKERVTVGEGSKYLVFTEGEVF